MTLRPIRLLPLLLIVGPLLIVAGCNDRVFVEPLPSFEPFTLSPGGDSIEVNIGRSGAERLTLATRDGSFHGNIYEIEPDGTISTSSYGSIPLPGGLLIESESDPTLRLTIMSTTDGKVSVELGHCYSTASHDLDIIIEYPYGAVEIPLRCDAIRPFVAVAIDYPSGFTTTDDTTLTPNGGITIANNSPKAVTATLRPLQDSSAKILFEVDSQSLASVPLDPDVSDIPLPSVSGGTVGLHGFAGPFRPDEEYYLQPPGLADVVIKVEVPANTVRQYYYYLETTIISGRYRATLRSPSLTNHDLTVTGNLAVTYPLGYLIAFTDL